MKHFSFIYWPLFLRKAEKEFAESANMQVLKIVGNNYEKTTLLAST